MLDDTGPDLRKCAREAFESLPGGAREPPTDPFKASKNLVSGHGMWVRGTVYMYTGPSPSSAIAPCCDVPWQLMMRQRIQQGASPQLEPRSRDQNREKHTTPTRKPHFGGSQVFAIRSKIDPLTKHMQCSVLGPFK